MGKVFDAIDDSMADFIRRQQMFFVASAPLSGEGKINLSPKGLDSLRILDGRTVAYADLVGSGIETVAHLQENGRVVLMFCAFEGPPKIVRLHGQGEVIEPSHDDFEQLRSQFPELTGLRCFIRVHCDRISDSCGFGVPLYDYTGQRSQLTDWAKVKGPEALAKYQRENNEKSLDDLPGIGLPTGDHG
ncbi:MAG: pyridoxamine 5'-phosphate oxidase family protein [Planctomycetes bacterium]|nr:pyridoxamine 5'-phosphate oxidase family protein [Planctomycetota bacterium]